MNQATYVVIHGSEDGLRITKLSKEELQKGLDQGTWYGPFLSELPESLSSEDLPLGTIIYFVTVSTALGTTTWDFRMRCRD